MRVLKVERLGIRKRTHRTWQDIESRSAKIHAEEAGAARRLPSSVLTTHAPRWTNQRLTLNRALVLNPYRRQVATPVLLAVVI